MTSRSSRRRPAAVLALASVLPMVLSACEEGAPPFGTEPAAEPTLFAEGVVSTGGTEEYAIAFSRDGQEAYFTRSQGGRRGRPELFVTRVENGGWTEPEPVPFSTGWEETPYLTPDGRRLIFSSRRPVPAWGPVPGDMNLWVVERTEEGWSEPAPLEGDVNRPQVDRDAPDRDEIAPVVLADGTLLYSSEQEPERGSDIYAADLVEGRYVNIRPMLLNTAGTEASPTLSPDGRYLVFHGYRDPYAPGDDLFVSERTEYGWSDPVPLPEPINTRADEQHPRFSPDGSLLFFSSDRNTGRMSIYYVSVEAAGLEPPAEEEDG